jgi:hypothetical protein
MKLSRLTAFTLGVIVTAVSVSAVSYVNALNDKPIKACADRKTGVMRYIVKGRCKRTERALTWNQVGPQGIQGIQGAKGETGSTGAASASQTPTGTSVFDNSGNFLGNLVGLLWGNTYDTFYLARDDHYFYLGSDGGVYQGVYFTEDNCTGTPFLSHQEPWHRALPQHLLTITLAEDSTSAKFYEYVTNTITAPLTPRSRLADNSSYGMTAQLDGRGSCLNIDWTWRVDPSRILREIPPPFALDTTGPLRLSTPQR